MTEQSQIENVEQQPQQQQTETKEKRIRNFTFKIDIAYLLEGEGIHYNWDKEVQKKYHELEQAFDKFAFKYVDEGYDVLHDQDYEMQGTEQQMDDEHMHFIVCAYNPATESVWRKRLESYGLHFTDANRIEAQRQAGIPENKIMCDFKELDKKNLARAVAYLIHRTIQSIIDGKYAYDESKIHATGSEPELAKQIRIDKYLQEAVQQDVEAQNKSKKILHNDQMKLVSDNFVKRIWKGAILSELRTSAKRIFEDSFPQFWLKYKDKFKSEIRDYSADLYRKMTYLDRDFKLFYVSGIGGVGKSRISNALAYYFSDKRDLGVHIPAVNGKRKTFDLTSTYNNELVTVAHEFSPSSMGVDEFEAFADPHIFPTLNSRNFDKPYFAQSIFIPNAKHIEDWMYDLIYDDYVARGKNPSYYGWVTEVQCSESYVDKMSFPSSYNNFLKYFENENLRNKMFKNGHWSYAGIEKFFVDWWQVLRRFSYLIEVEKTDGKKGALMTVSKLNSTGMRPLKNINDIFYNMCLVNHLEVVGKYACSNILDEKELNANLQKMLEDLQSQGLTINQELPQLQSNAEIAKMKYDDGMSSVTKLTKKDNDKYEVDDEELAKEIKKMTSRSARFSKKRK